MEAHVGIGGVPVIVERQLTRANGYTAARGSEVKDVVFLARAK
jgi:hypothetical protein